MSTVEYKSWYRIPYSFHLIVSLHAQHLLTRYQHFCSGFKTKNNIVMVSRYLSVTTRYTIVYDKIVPFTMQYLVYETQRGLRCRHSTFSFCQDMFKNSKGIPTDGKKQCPACLLGTSWSSDKFEENSDKILSQIFLYTDEEREINNYADIRFELTE